MEGLCPVLCRGRRNSTTPDNANGTDYYRRHNGATWYSDILSNADGSAEGSSICRNS